MRSRARRWKGEKSPAQDHALPPRPAIYDDPDGRRSDFIARFVRHMQLLAVHHRLVSRDAVTSVCLATVPAQPPERDNTQSQGRQHY